MSAGNQHSLTKLFSRFINESLTGKRMKQNGKKIKPQTVDNYRYILLLLQEYERYSSEIIFVNVITSRNKRILLAEKKYWKKFYFSFTDFLYKQKKCYDNYVGTVIKTLRIFFRYLQTEKAMPINDFYKQFYIYREEIPIITLMPDQLRFLIHNPAFDSQLSAALLNTKNIFILGCTVALRYSDLLNMKFTDIELYDGNSYLCIKSIKTETVTRVKLPEYALHIISTFTKHEGNRKTILPPLSNNQFNKNIKIIGEKAGWTNVINKRRSQRGKEINIKKEDGTTYRFCDLLSSHTMRRTAVSTMLMLGMPELTVRKISGHAANSKAFERYINLSQSYLDTHIDKIHAALTA